MESFMDYTACSCKSQLYNVCDRVSNEQRREGHQDRRWRKSRMTSIIRKEHRKQGNTMATNTCHSGIINH
jgi:hypothetical protein